MNKTVGVKETADHVTFLSVLIELYRPLGRSDLFDIDHPMKLSRTRVTLYYIVSHCITRVTSYHIVLHRIAFHQGQDLSFE